MTVRTGTFTYGDLTLSYEEHGQGERAVVYLHGLLLDSHVNRRLAEDLARAGNRVVLLDLPGHGSSSRPRRATEHRMDTYANHVVALLDTLGIDRAVIGGVSLGADVALQVCLAAPGRVAGMVIEMPVLERATPVAALIFTPLLAFTHAAAPVMRKVSAVAQRFPRHRLGLAGQVFGPFLLEPEEIVAVLHGILVGPVAPTAAQRSAMDVPALVIGHRSDHLHPFGDATRLAAQLPAGRLLEARSIWELRVRPQRLTAEIAGFLDDLWDEEGSMAARPRRVGRSA